MFGDAGLRRRVRLTSANSVNIGRLLPQMVYYFHAIAQVAELGHVRLHPAGLIASHYRLHAERQFRQTSRRA